MIFPQNLATAIEVENIIRLEGAIPATIAIIDGKIHIGLERNQLEFLARAGHVCRKVSRRDLIFALADYHGCGSTTVSATSFLANKVGINVFVTGGIGGVHRGVEESNLHV
jgi:pseudouridine-5'-phosphate glycosidase